MDYSGKNMRIVGGYLDFYLFFNDDICYKYLDMSAQDLEVDIDHQPQFADLSCDLVDGDVMICAHSEKDFLKLLQFIADTYRGMSVKAFFIACNVERNLINRVDFLNESAKRLTRAQSKKLHEVINNWKDEMCNYLMSNFDWIEYCIPERESSFDDNGICNYIKFPKNVNGRTLTDVNLQEIIDSLYGDDQEMDYFKEKLLGPFTSKPEIVDTPDAKYIVWNYADMDDYDSFTAELINKLYRY